MVVKPGYKQTEVGVIPEDWEYKTFGEIFTGFISGQTPSRSKPEFFKGNIPWITSGELNHGIVYDSIEKITEEAIQKTNIQIFPKGTFIFAIIGLDAEGTRGNCAVTGIDAAINQSCMALLSTGNVSINYLFYYYEKLGNLLALRYCQGTKQQNYSGTIVRKLPIVFPKNPDEQCAIATALSDTDARITSLDHLIAKRRDIKQAAMQDLLTGKRRLSGFSKPWETKCLGEIGDISSAGVDKKCRQDEVPVRLVNYLDVYRKDFLFSKDLNHWVTARPDQIKRCDVKMGDVFFTPSSETYDDIGVSAIAMENIADAVYSYHIVRFRLRDEWDILFRAYAFKTKTFLDEAQRQCEGSGTRYTISLGKFRNMTVQVPPVTEQRAIATVLSDMDAELAAVEQQRDKTRAIKQGMMQELLTGRIRLT